MCNPEYTDIIRFRNAIKRLRMLACIEDYNRESKMSLTIIGFGKTTRNDLGPAGKGQYCVWCAEDVCYRVIRVNTWFTYFFIPIIPYRRQYRVECPVCGSGVAITLSEAKSAKRGELSLRREWLG